jgi:hypothetical protein
MEQSPLKANSSSDSLKILYILWKPKFIAVCTKTCHFSISRATSIQPTPSQPISLRSVLLLSSKLRSRYSDWFPSVRFPKWNPIYTRLSQMCLVLWPFHSSCFDHPNSIRCVNQTKKLFILHFLQSPVYVVPFRPHPVLEQSSAYVPSSM